MSTWNSNKKLIWVFLLLVHVAYGQVSLRVFLRPPIVTLECHIKDVVEKASTIMMCPNDLMCFRNCERLCDKDCVTNVIKCTEENFTNGAKYTYTFDATNVRNQGEWTCHFGDQQSSTVIFLNTTHSKSTTPTSTTVNDQTTKTKKSPAKWPISITQNSKTAASIASNNRGWSIVNETYVIGLLVVFGISLCLNLVLISRTTIYKLSFKSLKKKSCFLKMCIKFFCVDEMKVLKKNKSNNSFYEDNLNLPRQLSSNIYECSPSSHLHPAILLDNYAFIGTPSSQRMFPSNIYSRSQSFPAKPVDLSTSDNICPTKSFNNSFLKSHFPELHSKPDSIGQIVYDDVAEPSVNYMPLNFLNRVNAHCRPSQYVSLNPTFNPQCSMSAMSMNNLAVTSFRLPEGNLDGDDCNEDVLLKDAINSRVELSKEMINQADTLLKRADTLLNDKESQNTINI